VEEESVRRHRRRREKRGPHAQWLRAPGTGKGDNLSVHEKGLLPLSSTRKRTDRQRKRGMKRRTRKRKVGVCVLDEAVPD